MRRGREWGLVAGVAGALCGMAVMLGATASAQTAGATPLPIVHSSFVQDGQHLVWSVRMGGAFSPRALQSAHRALCLQFVRHGGVDGRVCVIGPRAGGRSPRLVLQPVRHGLAGVARVIPATVTRADDAELSVRFSAAGAGLAYAPLRWQVLSSVRATGCRGIVVAGECRAFYPREAALISLHVPVPIGCVAAGPSEVRQIPPGRKEVALTFDDGPWNTPPTAQFLDVLEREHVVGTFFEIGRQISGYDPGGRLERRMLADGDFIGNHTWSHPTMTSLSSAAQQSELTSTSAAIRSATGGFNTCLWRPPYGAVNAPLVSLARSLGMLTIMWSVDPQDWSTPGESVIVSRVLSATTDGSIVLQHFGGGPRYQTLGALPQEIDALRRRGYRFVTVPELLGLQVILR